MASLNTLRDLHIGDDSEECTDDDEIEIDENHTTARLPAAVIRKVLSPRSFKQLETLSLDTTMQFSVAFLKACKLALSQFRLQCKFSTVDDLEVLFRCIAVNDKDRGGRMRHLSISMDGQLEQGSWEAFKPAKAIDLHIFELWISLSEPKMAFPDDVSRELCAS